MGGLTHRPNVEPIRAWQGRQSTSCRVLLLCLLVAVAEHVPLEFVLFSGATNAQKN